MKRIGIDISVVNDSQFTGIAVYTYNLIDNLLQINHVDEFILFGFTTFSTHFKINNSPLKNYPNVKLKLITLPSKAFRILFKTWQLVEFPEIDKLIGDVDLYHSFNWYFPPQKKGLRVATIFDTTPINNPSWHALRTVELDKQRYNRIATLADCIVTISESSRNDIKKIKPKGLIEVVYPGPNEMLEIKSNNNLDSKILKTYGLESNYILSVSTIEPRKNIEGLIKAYLKTNLENPLILVGKIGWKSEHIIKLINDNHQKIKHLGYLSPVELNVIYKNAACLVYPSFYEGFGIPVLEAMSRNVPVICSNISSLPEVGGDAVLYINPYNQNEISNAIISIVRDKSIRDDLKQKGLLQSKKFSWKNSAKKLDNIYKKLCT